MRVNEDFIINITIYSQKSLLQASSVPKFGAWNDNDSSSAAGYTVVFEKVRNEKKTVGSNATPEPPVRSPPVSSKNEAPVSRGPQGLGLGQVAIFFAYFYIYI